MRRSRGEYPSATSEEDDGAFGGGKDEEEAQLQMGQDGLLACDIILAGTRSGHPRFVADGWDALTRRIYHHAY
jgi:hypothetical protein